MTNDKQLANLPASEMETMLNQILGAMTIVAQGDTSYRLNLPADRPWGKIFNAKFEAMALAMQAEEPAYFDSQEIVAAVSEHVFQSLDYQAVVTNAAEAIAENTPVSGVAIYQFDEPSQALKMIASHGFSKEAVERGATLPIQGSLTGVAIARREVIIADDLGDDSRLEPEVKKALLAQGLKGVVSVPLFLQNDVLGAMNLIFDTSYPFTDHDKKMLNSIGKTIALAMVNAQYLNVIETEISERIEVEQRIQSSLERRTRQVQTSTDVAQEISAAIALDDLFQRVVALIQKQFGYYHVHLYTVEADDLVLQAGTGEAGKEMKQIGHKIAFSAKQSLVAQAARRGKAVLVEDVAKEAGWLPNPLLPETRAELAAPIKLRDHVLGVLDVQSNNVAGLSEEDQLLIMGLCGQIAVAIESRRADEALRQSEELYRTILENIEDGYYEVDLGGNITFFNDSAARIFERAGDELLGLNNREYMAEATARRVYETFNRVYTTGEAVKGYAYDVLTPTGANKSVEVSVSLKRDNTGAPTGFRGVIRDVTEQKRANEERERLLVGAENLTKELSVLNELGRALTTRLNVDEVLAEAHSQTARLVDATNFYVGLHIPEKNEIHFLLQVSESEIDRDIPVIKADQGLSGYIVQNRIPVLLEDNVNERQAALGIEAVGKEALSWLGVPMMISEQVLGLIAVQSYTTPALYDEHDQELLMAVANQIAVALQNARQFEESQRRARRERLLFEVSASMRNSLDPENIIKTGLQTIGQELSRTNTAIQLEFKE